MLLITTPTGNTGRAVLQAVLEAGETPRVLVRDPSRLSPETLSRIEVVQGDMHDPRDLERSLNGIEGAFFCVPQSPDPEDLSAYYRSFTEPFARAARTAGLGRLVSISGGDDQEDNRGPGRQLRESEEILNTSGASVRFVRCGYFMEQFLWRMYGVVQSGVFALPIAPSVPIPFVAAQDIGRGAAALLLDRTWTGRDTVAAHGPERLTCNQAAQVASEVLGRPVQFRSITAQQYAASLTPHGVSDAMGQSLGEMFEAISEGRDMGAQAAHELPCPTTLRDWMSTVLKPAVARLRAGASSS
ncbi:NmrA family NAD(P)-binding protein [Deinococcus sp.]|uniref:NmrA family NAD(P)-binding protein n=1 Tax=Deinococcus sp. TaxID=47478 RepID=UPI003C7B3C3B